MIVLEKKAVLICVNKVEFKNVLAGFVSRDKTWTNRNVEQVSFRKFFKQWDHTSVFEREMSILLN